MAATCLLHDRTAPATFSLYIRPDPARPWILSAGTSAVLDVLDDFSFGPDEIEHLASDAVGLHDDALDWLSDLELTGELRAVADGTIVLGEESLLEFTGPLPEAMLLETAIMAVAGFPTPIATKAARCAIVSGDAKPAGFGARRAHGLAEQRVHLPDHGGRQPVAIVGALIRTRSAVEQGDLSLAIDVHGRVAGTGEEIKHVADRQF